MDGRQRFQSLLFPHRFKTLPVFMPVTLMVDDDLLAEGALHLSINWLRVL
jgi:hypothetical protein